MILTTRIDIKKVLVIKLQPKGKTMAKHQEAQYTRLQKHTTEINRRIKTDQTGTPLLSTVNTDSNGRETLVIPGIQNKLIRMFERVQPLGVVERHIIARPQGDLGKATTGRDTTCALLSWIN